MPTLQIQNKILHFNLGSDSSYFGGGSFWPRARRSLAASSSSSVQTGWAGWSSRAPRPLPVRIVEDFLEPRRQLGRQAGAPRFVNDLDVEHVAQVHPIFIAERGQLHSNERFEPHHAVVLNDFGFVDVRRRDGVVRSDLFIRE